MIEWEKKNAALRSELAMIITKGSCLGYHLEGL